LREEAAKPWFAFSVVAVERTGREPTTVDRTREDRAAGQRRAGAGRFVLFGEVYNTVRGRVGEGGGKVKGILDF